MLFTILNGIFVGGLLGAITVLANYPLAGPKFWAVMLTGAFVNCVINVLK